MSLKVTKFSAVWCSPCRTFAPVFNKVSKSFKDIDFVEVDIDEEQELTASMGVKSVPTVTFEKDGVLVDTVVGLVSEKVLEDKITELL